MAVRYYDDAIIYKLKRWVPDGVPLRVLKPDETRRMAELAANDSGDRPLTLPFIALSRNNDIELLLNIKNSKSYDGIKLFGTAEATAQLNIIPIKLNYQLDIYTKTQDEADEYMRTFLFKLINNPVITIDIPYNSAAVGNNVRSAIRDTIQNNVDGQIGHIANIRVLNTVSDTSDIDAHLFSGQFYRWTIQLEIQDAFLFNIPLRQNWKIMGMYLDVVEQTVNDAIPTERYEISCNCPECEITPVPNM